MIKINNTEYRNLEEQVRYLTEQYNANQGIAEWGIRILGVLESPAELPDPATYTGEYGDAYAVGAEPPYNFYIWTRSAVVGTGGFWFDFGDIAIAGPQGPAGQSIVGPAGERGSLWYVKIGQPTTTSGYNVGDCYLNPATGNVWHLHDVEGTPTWLLEGNIRGPQGIQGIQGIQGVQGEQGPEGIRGPVGPAGPIVDVMGTIVSVDQLPDPSTVARQSAYLLQNGEAYEVYIIVGEDGNESWFNAGLFATGTLVMSGGSPIQTFDADTKLDKRTGVTQRNQAYVKTTAGENTMFDISVDSAANTLVRRKADGSILVPATPSETTSAASKQYVDARLKAPTTAASFETVPLIRRNTSGADTQISYTTVSQGTGGSTIALRTSEGMLKGLYSDSADDTTLVNKGAFDTALAAITSATIAGRDILSGTMAANAISSTEYGMFVVRGTDLTLSFVGNDVQYNEGTDLALIYRYKAGGTTKLLMIAFTGVITNPIKVIDVVAPGGISISNDGTYGARLIKMPMKAI